MKLSLQDLWMTMIIRILTMFLMTMTSKNVVQKCSASEIVVQICSATTLNITFCSAKL